MITKQFKNWVAGLLESVSGGHYGYLPVKATNGNTYYGSNFVGANSQFPRVTETGMSTSATAVGIVLGSGSTAATENDYAIETAITSGISCTPTYERGVDSSGNPYVEFTLVMTNTTSSDIVIREIAYNQNIYLVASQGATSATARVVCFDHTSLSSAVTVPAGGQNTIKYRLKTVMS